MATMLSNGPHHVSVHALSTGNISMPRRLFVTPIDDANERAIMPSMSFLIQHYDDKAVKTTRILFDLGIRADTSQYTETMQESLLLQDRPSNPNNVLSALAKGGLSAAEIDYVIFSHLHWDHLGVPSEFPDARFIIGGGGLSFLAKDGVNSTYESDLVPKDRTIELSEPGEPQSESSDLLFSTPWKPVATFENTMDIFADGSLLIVDTPGHMPGHINLLCRLETGRYVYLAGDLCHDRRIMTGQKDISTWPSAANPNIMACAHVDKAAAVTSIQSVAHVAEGNTQLGAVEVVLAHDDEWQTAATVDGRFFPGRL